MGTILDSRPNQEGMLDLGDVWIKDVNDFFGPIGESPEHFDWIKRVYMWKASKIGGLPYVGRLPNLNELTISSCQDLREIDGLSGSKGIANVRLQDSKGSFSLRPLAENPIRFLDLTGSTGLTDFDVLANFTGLTHGYFRGCKNLPDLEVFRGMTELEYLFVSDLPNVNLEPLANHHRLRYLGLSNCGMIRNADVLTRLLRPEDSVLTVYVNDGSRLTPKADALFEDRERDRRMRPYWERHVGDRREIDKPSIFLIKN